MPRPVKNRFVCNMPRNRSFTPGCEHPAEAVVLTVDEYEAVRLIDRERLNQEECARQMGVARTTVQTIYDGARKKIAEAIVDGKKLEIRGGSYTLCGRCGKASEGVCRRRGKCGRPEK